jgi:hypothetical protein
MSHIYFLENKCKKGRDLAKKKKYNKLGPVPNYRH